MDITIPLLLMTATVAQGSDPAADIARTIDRRLAADWQTHGVQPSPAVDDLAFLRRLSLDLIGRIPTYDEVRRFRDDLSTDKRRQTIDRLLTSREFALHFANQTRVDWMPQSLGNFRTQFEGGEFEAWLEKEIRANRPFDQIVKSILTAEAKVGQRGQFSFGGRQSGDQTALSAFYVIADGKPEEMAAAASRLFLGVKLECAQCHDHPFAPYSREQFWQFAAFFGEFTPLSPVGPSFVGPLPPQFESNRIGIPNTDREVTARLFADEFEPNWTTDRTPRRELADWLTKPGNRLFARNLANRLWAYVFGIGLVDPVDEPGDQNPPSHPELLDDLTNAVMANNYNLRVLFTGLLSSDAYRRSSKLTHPSQADPKRFARYAVRGLTGHQIYDSLQATTGELKIDENSQNRRFASSEIQGPRGELVSRFPQSSKKTETTTSILQSLLQMNGTHVATVLAKHPVIDKLTLSKEPPEKIVDELLLRFLIRVPSREERIRYATLLKGVPADRKRAVVEDIVWVLVNSAEFGLNH